MTAKASESTAFLTKPQLLSDLQIVSQNPSLLDAFLPPDIRSTSDPAYTSPNASSFNDYSTTQENAKESVKLSYAFKEETRGKTLKYLDVDGAREEGKVIGDMGEKLDNMREEAEGLQSSLEGLDSA